ncbi:DsrE family protein [Muriicola sp. Z0-33]|nr:DsrE family protein [Muriicola sp. Z0-33]
MSMRRGILFLGLALLFFSPVSLFSQSKQSGPIIKSYGKVWEIEDPTYITNVSKEFRVVFDIMNSPESHSEINKSIETAARFLNMHAQSGVPKENLKVVLVVHNQASKDIINNQAYQKRFAVNNPNEKLVRELIASGAKFVFCGQSSLSRNYPVEETIEGVELALSAMTALIQLQDDGYQLIKF